MQDLINEYLRQYGDLWGKFTVERKLPMDPDTWSEKDQNDWFNLSDELNQKIDKLREQQANLPLDQQHPDDWYIIDVSIDSHDGPDSEEIDVRKLPLDKLKDVCSIFPRYNEYYFQKVSDSL